MAGQSSTPSPLEAFKQRYLTDREMGTVLRLEDYLSAFPGESDSIARAFLELEGTRDEITTLLDGTTRKLGLPFSRTVGPYTLLGELGRGGQAIVYLAEDPRLRRKVAVKILQGLGPGSEDLRRRFQQGAEVVSRLDHPGICTLYQANLDEYPPYIAMQYVEGESLAAKISLAVEKHSPETASHLDLDAELSATEATPDPPAEVGSDSARFLTQTLPQAQETVMHVVRLVEQVARTLHFAHERGVVHRDIKPGNIMVTPQQEPVLMDFDMSRDHLTEQYELTRTGDAFGTPAYMSPEQLNREPLDRRTDVWSLGVTLYQCVTLQRPFQATTREGLYQAILTKEPADIRKLNPLMPEDLAVVVSTALEKNRNRRYQSALELAEELRRVQEGEPILARPTPLRRKVWRLVRRHPGASIAWVLAGLLVITWVMLLMAWSDLEMLRTR